VFAQKRDYGCFLGCFPARAEPVADHRYAPGVSWTCPPLVEWGRLALIRTTSAPLYAGRVRSASIITLCVLAAATAGCASASASGSGSGSGSAPKRSLPVVKECLHATHLAATPVLQGNLLDSLHPRPVSLLWVRRDPGALIALYATDAGAVKIFRGLRTTLPVLQHDNALVLSMITPQPTRTLRARIERCAFGPGAKPSTGPIVGKRA